MRTRSMLIAGASLLGLVGGCAADTVTTNPYYYDTYMYPVVDYGYYDTVLWYDGYYDPYIGYLTAARPGGGTPDSGRPRTFPRPLNGVFSQWRTVLRPDCAPAVEWVDFDEDGIPATYDATFACADQTLGDRTSSVTGMVSIHDADDSAKLSGYTVTFTNFTVATSVGGLVRTRTLNGTASLMPNDAGGFQTSTNIDYMFDFADSGRTRIQGTYTAMNQSMYTPDPSAGDDVFASGNVTLTGTGTLSRMFANTGQSRSVVRETTTPLHWNRDCRRQNADSSGFDSGTLVFQDNQRGRLQLQFNGCGAATITTGG